MQGINVFASTAARDAAITSPQEGQFAFTKDTNGLWYYDGAAWVASGATGDIEGVTAGIGISGGGTSGTVTVTNSMATAIDAKGDLIAGTGADAFSRLVVGANNTVLTADSAEATGLKWATPTSGGMTLLSTTTLTSTTTTISSISGSYKNLLAIYRGVASGGGTFGVRTNGVTTSNYYYANEEIGNGLAFASAWVNGGTEFLYTENIGADANNTGYFLIYDYASTASSFKWCETCLYSDAGDDILRISGVNRGNTTTAIDSITFFSPSAATISGTVLLYGVS
jgi:hypothetical protein